jgi:hypothetical protein
MAKLGMLKNAWERVGGVFRNLYRAIVERLPLFLRGALTFKKRPMLNAV